METIVKVTPVLSHGISLWEMDDSGNSPRRVLPKDILII